MVFRSRVLVGVDVGHQSVKAAVMTHNRRQVLDLLEKEALPGRQFLDDAADDDAVAAAVRDMLAPYAGPKAKYNATIGAAVQGEGIIAHYVELPRLEKKQLQVAQEAASVKFVPYTTGEAVNAWIPIPPISGGDCLAWLFVATRKKAFDATRDLFRRAGIRLEKMEASFLPMLRSSIRHEGGKAPGFQGLVHVGSRMTTLCVLREGNPYSVRAFRIGGADFTYALQMGAQSTWAEAEAHKRSYDATAREVAVEPALARWLEQVRRSLEAFHTQHAKAGARVERIVLSGGSSAWKGLGERVSEELKLPVSVDGFGALAPPVGNGAPAGTFKIALGMCLD